MDWIVYHTHDNDHNC